MHELIRLGDKSISTTKKLLFVWLHFQKNRLDPLKYSYNIHDLKCDFSWIKLEFNYIPGMNSFLVL